MRPLWRHCGGSAALGSCSTPRRAASKASSPPLLHADRLSLSTPWEVASMQRRNVRSKRTQKQQRRLQVLPLLHAPGSPGGVPGALCNRDFLDKWNHRCLHDRGCCCSRRVAGQLAAAVPDHAHNACYMQAMSSAGSPVQSPFGSGREQGRPRGRSGLSSGIGRRSHHAHCYCAENSVGRMNTTAYVSSEEASPVGEMKYVTPNKAQPHNTLIAAWLQVRGNSTNIT